MSAEISKKLADNDDDECKTTHDCEDDHILKQDCALYTLDKKIHRTCILKILCGEEVLIGDYIKNGGASKTVKFSCMSTAISLGAAVAAGVLATSIYI